MRKRKSTTNLIQFPATRKQARSLSDPDRPLTPGPSLYMPIQRARTILFCDAINDRFRGDGFGLEAVLGLICAIVDPDGDPKKVETAQTALRLLTVENLTYKPIAAYFKEATGEDAPDA